MNSVRKLLGQGFKALAVAIVLSMLVAAVLLALGVRAYPVWMAVFGSNELAHILCQTGYRFMIGVMGTFYGGMRLFEYGRALAMPTAAERLRDDGRPPVLLLRSDRDDGIPSRATPSELGVPSTLRPPVDVFEDDLASSLEKYGPVVKLRGRGEHGPGVGAAHLIATDEDWQTEVLSLMTRARLIVLVVGNTRGVVWELMQISERGYEAKTLLLAPPFDRVGLVVRWTAFVLALAEADLGHNTPGWRALRVALHDASTSPTVELLRARAKAFMEEFRKRPWHDFSAPLAHLSREEWLLRTAPSVLALHLCELAVPAAARAADAPELHLVAALDELLCRTANLDRTDELGIALARVEWFLPMHVGAVQLNGEHPWIAPSRSTMKALSEVLERVTQ